MPAAVAAVAEPEEVVVVVEQLSNDDVGAGVHLALEVLQVRLPATGPRDASPDSRPRRCRTAGTRP